MRDLRRVLLLVALASCTSDVEPLTPAQRQAVEEYVSKVAPSPANALDASFGGKVKLLGYDVDRSEWQPGDTLRVTWYWQAVEPLEKGWALFTRIEGPAGRQLDQNGNSTLRWLYGPDRWRVGEYVRDVQLLHLPDDWTDDVAQLYVGVAREAERLPLDGSPEASGRFLATTTRTPQTTPPSAGAVPEIGVVQTKQPPRLDGLLDDPVWRFANTSRAFVDTLTGGAAPFRAFAKVLWDRRYLYVGVDVQDAFLLASHTQHDDHLWEQDCVELMVDPDGDGRHYFEIQVSPGGVVFDTWFESRRVPKPFGHINWSSKARVSASLRGTLDDDVADAGYTVEIAIPWQAFSSDGRSLRPPAIGDKWRANLYVMNADRKGQKASAWSPPEVGDFHVPRRFGILAFEGTPKEMVGTSEPKRMPSERMPAGVGRGGALDRGVRDKLIKSQAINRGSPGEPPPPVRPNAENLEPGEASH
jgi:hypothetical protein